MLTMRFECGDITRRLVRKELAAPKSGSPVAVVGLNGDQSAAIGEMLTTHLHLLWGPPGTGKTTTLGTAVVQWMRQGKRVLVVSTSNAAVDVAMRAVLDQVVPTEKDRLLRLGNSLDPQVRELTYDGKTAERNGPLAGLILVAQHRLDKALRVLTDRNTSAKDREKWFAEVRAHQAHLDGLLSQLRANDTALPDIRITGSTLAQMVLTTKLREQRFDVVVVDEASMVSVLFALAASMLATSHLVIAGDPKQLPPIFQAKDDQCARDWLGGNIYDWLDLNMDRKSDEKKLRLLRTQYRMTNQIGQVVSRLGYGNLLIHGRQCDGPEPIFIDVPQVWRTNYCSVKEQSYYHLAAIPLIHGIRKQICCDDEVLLLTPFRPQRSLLAALAFDLKLVNPEGRTAASTIHRSQGSEARAVILDLTTHSPQHFVAFFKDPACAKLLNVAISRARDRLVIIGSQAMLQQLSKTMPFWGRVMRELGGGLRVMECDDILQSLEQHESLDGVAIEGSRQLSAIYSHAQSIGSIDVGVGLLNRVVASRKLLVCPGAGVPEKAGDCIVRNSQDVPPLFVGGGVVCLPYNGKWVAVHSPNASRVIWRIGFSHLADEEADPSQVRRFFCPRCANGSLVLQHIKGEGWFLVCTNSQTHGCLYRRRLSLHDAKLKVRLQGMTCPKGHPLTAVESGNRIDLRCENRLRCWFKQSLAILSGV